jgi:hypothetical protein
VIAASQAGDVPFGFGANERAAMPADVVKRADRRFVAAYDDDGFIADFVEKIIALVADPVDVACDDPFASRDPVHVGGEHGIVAVEFTLQAITALGARGQARNCAGIDHGSFSDGRGVLFSI